MTSTATEITEATILENRRRWAEALRSGEYEQTQGALCVAGAYCCLGVAAKLVDGRVRGAYERSGADYSLSLPDNKDARKFGLLSSDGDVGRTAILDPSGLLATLDELNDSYGFTFAEIADLIDDGQVELHVPAGGAA